MQVKLTTGTAMVVGLIGVLWAWSSDAVATIDIELKGVVTFIDDGGFPTVPPLSDDLSLGSSFKANLVLDEDAPFSRTDDETFPTATQIIFEERFFWTNALQSASFDVGTLSGSGNSGSFSYTFIEITDTAVEPSGLPIEHTDFSQTRENTMNMNFADGGSIANGALIYTLENNGTPDPYLSCVGNNMRCLLESSEWQTRRVLITAFQRGSALVQITSAVVQPEALLGDANNDRQVTGADLIAVQQHFSATEPLPPTGMLLGDANDDGQVSGADLITVQQRFGDALAPSSPVIPEPAIPVIMGFVFAVLTLVGRRDGKDGRDGRDI